MSDEVYEGAIGIDLGKCPVIFTLKFFNLVKR